ncbi:hypothetical protein DES53_112160 [Roseimicrobium gellanilyticum]|uniref:Uncharacterized protein n=1 Tax=Roseimicrobium gellanilyticum TaxID=748857 RepID=A0A366H7M1_9BACT|nr:hypothetical protein DES53_112160 [Roseimicrobium gellanilyticum]
MSDCIVNRFLSDAIDVSGHSMVLHVHRLVAVKVAADLEKRGSVVSEAL